MKLQCSLSPGWLIVLQHLPEKQIHRELLESSLSFCKHEVQLIINKIAYSLAYSVSEQYIKRHFLL